MATGLHCVIGRAQYTVSGGDVIGFSYLKIMAITKIRLTNVFGKTVKFTKEKIESALIGRNAGVPEHWGEAHVWAEDPLMVCISKLRDTKRGPFHYELTEVDENCWDELIEIVHIEFTEEELDDAIKIFMNLCEKPKKTFQRRLLKKLGGHVIFLNDFVAKGPMG